MSRRYGVYALVLLCACSSKKPLVGVVGVDSPPLQASAGAADGGTDASMDGGESVMYGPDYGRHLPGPTEIVEEQLARCLSPVEKSIIETCPERPWSTNVPDRPCAKDDECGEGYCDRGNCQPIYTCDATYGSPCKESRFCYGMCVDGRCRSCISHDECQAKNTTIRPHNAHLEPMICTSEDARGLRGCGHAPDEPPPQ